ncbi:MAG: hypothetical protein WCC17_10865, partial [Candidatus Nitrosopolaris sp.]
MTIESSVRNKVIELHRNGKKRHEIAYELNQTGIKMSTGSISNVISESRERGHKQSSPQPSPSPLQKPENASISTGIPKNKIDGSPALMASSCGTGLATETSKSKDSDVLKSDLNKSQADRITTFTEPL